MLRRHLRWVAAPLVGLIAGLWSAPRAQAGFDCFANPSSCTSVIPIINKAKQDRANYLAKSYPNEYAQSADYKSTLYAGFIFAYNEAQKNQNVGEVGLVYYKDKYGFYYHTGVINGEPNGSGGWITHVEQIPIYRPEVTKVSAAHTHPSDAYEGTPYSDVGGPLGQYVIRSDGTIWYYPPNTTNVRKPIGKIVNGHIQTSYNNTQDMENPSYDVYAPPSKSWWDDVGDFFKKGGGLLLSGLALAGAIFAGSADTRNDSCCPGGDPSMPGKDDLATCHAPISMGDGQTSCAYY